MAKQYAINNPVHARLNTRSSLYEIVPERDLYYATRPGEERFPRLMNHAPIDFMADLRYQPNGPFPVHGPTMGTVDTALAGIETHVKTLVRAAAELERNNEALERVVQTQHHDLKNLRNEHNKRDKEFMDIKAQRIQTADDNDAANRIVTTMCCVCLVEAAICVMVPCGHLCLCSDCRPPAYRKQCPMCKAKVSMIMKIYTV